MTARDVEQAYARMQDYTGKAVLAFLLYSLLWFPGLVANWCFYQEARKMERRAGEHLPGVGCLFWLLVINLFWLFLCGAFVWGGLGGKL